MIKDYLLKWFERNKDQSYKHLSVHTVNILLSIENRDNYVIFDNGGSWLDIFEFKSPEYVDIFIKELQGSCPLYCYKRAGKEVIVNQLP